jgi:hypothetical protein
LNKGLLYKGLILIFALLIITSIVLGCTAKQPDVTSPLPSPAPTPAPTPTPTPTPTEEVDISDYMPMKVGYTWEYEGEGNEYASYTSKIEFAENNRFQEAQDNGGTLMANIYEVRDDSIVHVYQMGENYEHKNLLKEKDNLNDVILKLPLQAGNKWIGEENSYEIIDTKATITVPYGTFTDCVVVKRTYKDGSESFMHYKEGIGLIQSEFRSGDFKVFSRLKNFTSI